MIYLESCYKTNDNKNHISISETGPGDCIELVLEDNEIEHLEFQLTKILMQLYKYRKEQK